MRKLGSLKRYVEEHPRAEDREEAALAYVRVYVERAQEYYLPWSEQNSRDFGKAAE